MEREGRLRQKGKVERSPRGKGVGFDAKPAGLAVAPERSWESMHAAEKSIVAGTLHRT